jgi:hypothetical protein
MSMLGSQNPRRQNPPLALRLRIDDLRAQLAPLDLYGPTGLSSAITDGVRMLAGGWRAASRGLACCAEDGGED